MKIGIELSAQEVPFDLSFKDIWNEPGLYESVSYKVLIVKKSGSNPIQRIYIDTDMFEALSDTWLTNSYSKLRKSSRTIAISN